jgi:prevent-host-death family protein
MALKPNTKTAVGEVKTKYLAGKPEVQTKRTKVTIPKNGKATVASIPAPSKGKDSIFGFCAGKVKIVGDITAPLYTDEEWEEFFENEAAKYDVPAEPVPGMKTMGVTEAKATFLSLVTEVETKRGSITLTRNGRKVARIIPAEEENDPLARYKFGGGRIVENIDSPANDPDDWEYD